MFKVKGIIKTILEEQLIKEKYKKQFIMLKVRDGEYLNDIGIEFFGDYVEKLNGYAEGEEVEVSFNIKGNLWNGKVFNNVQAWRIERSSVQAEEQRREVKIPEDSPFAGGNGGGNEDDLPF